MQQLEKLYRFDYTGEHIVTEMRHVNSTWEYQREFVPNPVTNTHISNQAVVIGNGSTRRGFDLTPIKLHKGGLLASNALQSYGCNASYRDLESHFLVASSDAMAHELATNGYCDNHIVYASSEIVLKYPGRFYLIPQDVQFDAGSVATYLACFDGHKKVFLLGFDAETGDYEDNMYIGTNGYAATAKENSNTSGFYTKSLLQIMNLYNDVDFVRVMPSEYSYMPEEWKYVTNLRQITYRNFVLEADL